MKRVFPYPLVSQGINSNESVPRRKKSNSESEVECKLAKEKKKEKKRFYGNLFNDYCENTTIHGVKYFGENNRPRLERWWWIISFVISIVLCTILIRNLWIKWEESPVFVSFAERSTAVWEIPFPAVTICPETKARKSLFDYTDVYHRIDQAIQNGSVPELSDKDSKIYEAVSQVCDAHLSEFKVGNLTSSGKDIVETLERVGVKMDWEIFQCKWRNDLDNCTDILSPILTEEGMCLTFNTVNAREMFRMENMHRDYDYLQHNQTGEHWNFESGYSDEASHAPYPLRVLNAGARAGLTVLMPLYKQDMDFICRGPVQGFKIHLHTPGEMPRVSKQYFRVPLNQEVIVAVKPNMITTSAGLKGYNPNRRQCYFNGERYLRFFQVYTQQNCQLECLTNYTLTKCGCVKFSMPRDQSTPVCGAKSVTCYNEAEDDHLWQEFYDGLVKEASYTHGGNTECNCLPSCTSIAYDAELSQANFDWTNLFQAYRNPVDEFPGVQFARLSIYFKETQFITSRRSELYGPTDFLANCGGLLGLFMGVSLLSLVEIIYYLTVRLCWTRRERLKENEKNKKNEETEDEEYVVRGNA